MSYGVEGALAGWMGWLFGGDTRGASGFTKPSNTAASDEASESTRVSNDVISVCGTDLALIDAIRAGNRDTFGALFQQYWPRLYRFALGYVRVPAVAEDLVSEMFLRLWRGRATWAPRGTIEIYLYSALRNHITQYFRDRQRLERRTQNALSKSVIPGMGMSAPSADIEQERRDESAARDRITAMLWDAVAAMPERRRLILMLRWREQKSYAEIAAMLGMSRPAVQMQVDRAVKALRATLRGFSQELPPE